MELATIETVQAYAFHRGRWHIVMDQEGPRIRWTALCGHCPRVLRGWTAMRLQRPPEHQICAECRTRESAS